MQSVVNELFIILGIESVSGAAFSQVRAHFRHMALMELNEKRWWRSFTWFSLIFYHFNILIF